jgi:hypothetical protein
MNALWLNGKGRWDQGLLAHALRGDLWNTPAFREYVDEFPPIDNPVVAILAHKQSDDVVERLKQYPFVLSIHTSDEAHEWDASGLSPLWMGYANAEHNGDRNILIGWPEDTMKLMPPRKPWLDREFDWAFTGQVNHKSRQEMADILADMSDGSFYRAQGFNRGTPREEHLRILTEARVAPCPAGTVHPDSFRLYEALEAGCLPIVEGDWFFDQFHVPFPVVQNWRSLPTLVDSATADDANVAVSWWQQYKREFALNLMVDCGVKPKSPLTVMIPTSPIPSHPSTELIEETIESIRSRLPDSEIIVMVDGLHPSLERWHDNYAEYARRLLELSKTIKYMVPIVFTKHHHQAAMMQKTLELVRNSYVLFVEHDTPLLGDIPFDGLIKRLEEPDVNLIRLFHYNTIPVENAFMFGARDGELIKTYQFSARPHLAKTDFYRKIMRDYFMPGEVGFIEERMEPICRHGGWGAWRGMWIYAPAGTMLRSTHSDGRRGEAKVPTER